MEEKIITCPNCDTYLCITELNCCIFRCGIYKKTNEQINPHLSEENCKKLIETNQIYGCGKPFQIIVQDNGDWIVQKCDYI
jgi:hypothetical protein